jgi:ABC-type lipoprotein export system ATPase subunit
MITHEEDVAKHADRRLVLSDGRLHNHGSAEAQL